MRTVKRVRKVALMDKDAVLAVVDQAFGHLHRPETMVRDPNHCEECAEHEAVMQAATPQTITLNEIGNPGWDPVCYLSDEAFCYFMPGFSRLALDTSGFYLSQFFFHLDYDQSFRIKAFDSEQCRATLQLIHYIGETMPDKVTDHMVKDELDRVKERLTDAS